MKKPAPISAEYFCVSCKTPFLNRFPLDLEGRCLLCRTGARGFDTAYCFGSYDGVLRELIHLFKYARIKPLARPLAAKLAGALPLDRAFDVVAPMPLHWRRKWTRGFNQSELLARFIARRRRIPMKKVVSRVRATATQAGLTNSKRRTNVAGAFRVKRPQSVAGLRILLIDDVMTTGATASACAAAMKAAGAASVTLVTLARVDRRFAGASATANAGANVTLEEGA